VAVKFGVLTNGNDVKVDKAKMSGQLQSLMADWLQMNSGLDAAKRNNEDDEDEDDETFRFKGALDLIGHLTNSFGRREICVKAGDQHANMLFACVNQAKALKAQAEAKKVSAANFALVLRVLAVIPVKPAD